MFFRRSAKNMILAWSIKQIISLKIYKFWEIASTPQFYSKGTEHKEFEN